MISTIQMDALAVNSGITADVLAKAISDEKEIKLELPNGRFLTKDNEDKLLDNHGKKKYDEGKSKGSKEILETVKTSHELEGDTVDDIMGNFKTNILKDAKLEPNEKLAEKDKAIKTLQDKYTADIGIKDTEIDGYKSQISSAKNKSSISGFLPELKEGYSKSDATTLFSLSHEIKEDGIYKDGKLLVDDMQSNLDLEKAVGLFIEEKGWSAKKIQGHGNKKPTYAGATPKSYEDFQKYCESKGWSEGSLPAKQYLKSLRDKNPDFDMN